MHFPYTQLKNLLIIFFLTFAASSFAQSYNSYTTKQDTCLDKQFSIVFYVVLDSSGTVGLATPANLQIMINNVNDVFKKICVKFKNCSTVFIPEYRLRGWFNDMQGPATENVVTDNWYTPNTINVYIVDTVYNLPNVMDGQIDDFIEELRIAENAERLKEGVA